MSIYTKTGDDGTTALYGGARLGKDDLRVCCYGTADEACSILGAAHAVLEAEALKRNARAIQRRLFVLSAQLAADEENHGRLPQHIAQADIAYLERMIDDYSRDFGALRGFSIPGETLCSSLIHMARTVVRRCERHVAALAKREFVCPLVMRYLNRLSDALYVMAKQEVFHHFVRRVALKVAEAAGNPPPEFGTERICEALYQTARRESADAEVAVSLCVADEAGNPVFFHRQEGAILASAAIAQKKAYTAAAMRMETGWLAAESQPGKSLFGIHAADERLVILGGGFPLWRDGRLVGAIGVSGGTVEQDERIGNACVRAFQDLLPR